MKRTVKKLSLLFVSSVALFQLASCGSEEVARVNLDGLFKSKRAKNDLKVKGKVRKKQVKDNVKKNKMRYDVAKCK